MKQLRKRLRQLVAVVVLLSATEATHAQVDSADNMYNAIRACQSIWTNYSNFKESSSIVRSNNYNHVIHTQNMDEHSGLMSHTFIVKTAGSYTEKAFTTYFNSTDGTDFFVSLSDMRLFNDTCYFCGIKVYTYVNWAGEHETHGIVGCFVPKHMLADTGSLFFYEFDETSDLTRLAISMATSSNVLISAIGNKSTTNTACILEMLSSGGGPQWEYWLDTLITPQDVVFTDIMTMGDSIRLLLQYECANDHPYGQNDYDNGHQLFMLDRFGHNGCRASYNPMWVYYMAHYNMGFDGDCFFHFNKAPMRFSHLNDRDNQFGVAFGVEETDGNHGGLRMFPFRHEWSYDSCIYYRTSKRVEIKEVGNLHRTSTMFLLSKDSEHNKGMVTTFDLGSGTHDVTRLTAGNYVMNSLTQTFVGNHIDISGRSSSFGLHVLDQDIVNLSLPSCFLKTTQEYRTFPGRDAALLQAKWEFGEIGNFSWGKSVVYKPEIEKDPVCERCTK